MERKPKHPTDQPLPEESEADAKSLLPSDVEPASAERKRKTVRRVDAVRQALERASAERERKMVREVDALRELLGPAGNEQVSVKRKRKTVRRVDTVRQALERASAERECQTVREGDALREPLERPSVMRKGKRFAELVRAHKEPVGHQPPKPWPTPEKKGPSHGDLV